MSISSWTGLIWKDWEVILNAKKTLKKLSTSTSDTTKTELENFVGKKGVHGLFCI